MSEYESRNVYGDFSQYVIEPNVDVEKETTDKFPAQLGKDGATTFLDDYDLEILRLSIREKIIMDKLIGVPRSSLKYARKNILQEMTEIEDMALVRLNKSKNGQLLKLIYTKRHEVKYDIPEEMRKDGFLQGLMKRW